MSLKNTQVSTKSQDCSKRLQIIFGFLEAKPDLKKCQMMFVFGTTLIKIAQLTST